MYLCIFMTILMIPFIVLNQFWMIWHQSRYMGRVLATKMYVVLEYSSQGANGVKENRPLSLCITTLNSMFGTVLVEPHRMTRAAGCRFFLQPSGRLHLKGRGQGKEVEMLNHNVLWGNKFVFLVLQMTKKAARIAYKVRNWKDKRNPYEEFVL